MVNPLNTRINKKYFLFLLSHNRKLISLVSIILGIVFPLLYILTSFSEAFSNSLLSNYLGTLMFYLVCLIFIAAIIPLVTLSYLNSKKALDIYYAVPIKRDNLFATQHLANLVIVLLPSIFIFIIATLIAAGTGAFNSIDWSFILGIFILLLLVVFVVCAIISLSTFVVNNTGNVLNSFIYSIIIFAFPFILYLAITIFNSTLLSSLFVSSYRILEYTSPIFVLFRYVSNLLSSTTSLNSAVLWLGVRFSIYWAVISVLLYLINIILFDRRTVQVAEKPFANKYFGSLTISIFIGCLLFMFLSIFAVSYYGSNGIRLTVWGVLTPVVMIFIVYYVIDVISKKGFGGFFKSLIQYIAISVLTFALFFTGIKTNGFGLLNYVPSTSSIENISVTFYNNSYYSDFYTQNSVKITDTEEIELVRSVHKALTNLDLSNPSETNIYDDMYFNVSFAYSLKDGGTHGISYDIPFSYLTSISPLFDSETFLANIYPIIDLSAEPKITGLNSISGSSIPSYSITDIDVKKLSAALKSDISALGIDLLSQSNASILYILNYDFIYSDSSFGNDYPVGYSSTPLSIDDRFVNTIDYLDSLNLTFSDSPAGTSDDKFYLISKRDSSLPGYYSSCTDYCLNLFYSNVNEEIQFYQLSNEDYKHLSKYFVASGPSDTAHNVVTRVSPDGAAYSFILNEESEAATAKIISSNQIKRILTRDVIDIYYRTN